MPAPSLRPMTRGCRWYTRLFLMLSGTIGHRTSVKSHDGEFAQCMQRHSGSRIASAPYSPTSRPRCLSMRARGGGTTTPLPLDSITQMDTRGRSGRRPPRPCLQHQGRCSRAAAGLHDVCLCLSATGMLAHWPAARTLMVLAPFARSSQFPESRQWRLLPIDTPV